MNLTINNLPTKTWNHLGMNQTSISLEGEFSNHTPAAQWDAAQVLWNPEAEAAVLPTGVASELEALTTEAKIGFAQTQPGVTMTQPLVLTYAYENNEQAASRLVFHAGKGSTLKVALLLKSAGKDLSAIRTEVYAEEDARVEISVAQLLGEESVCLNEINGLCQERAVVNLTKLELGAGKLYAGSTMELRGRESEFNTEIGYHARENQLLDMNYVALHYGQQSQSLMEVAGTLEEGSCKIFRGTIDFKQGCAGSKGTESENVLLLGDNMVNQTIPLILCAEEDVEGNHGASIGRLDEKVLFYLGSRGISEQAAQQMIAQSRIEAICNKFPDAAIQDEIREFENQRGLSYESEL